MFITYLNFWIETVGDTFETREPRTIINSHISKAFVMISSKIYQDLQALEQAPTDKQMWMVQHIMTSDSHVSKVHSKATL